MVYHIANLAPRCGQIGRHLSLGVVDKILVCLEHSPGLGAS